MSSRSAGEQMLHLIVNTGWWLIKQVYYGLTWGFRFGQRKLQERNMSRGKSKASV